MKKVILLSFSLAITAVFAGNNKKHVDTYKVNTDISKVEWKASKVTGSHNGTVAIKSGSMQNNHGKWTGNFVIDMTTIVCSDLEGGAKRDLEAHLASNDFFAVEKNPTATLKIKSTTPSPEGNNNYTVVGDLTIKGITNEISFPAKIELKENKLAGVANLNIDRTKWDVKYGSGSFFDDLGDKAINDKIEFSVNIAAKK